MQRTETPDPFSGLEANHPAVGEFLLQNSQSAGVIGMMESRDQDDAIGDVKIGIAGGQALALVLDKAGHGQLHDSKIAVMLVSRRANPAQVIAQ
mgnify:FL=1